jgi:very-short-patch-repair endonuclease
MDDELRPHPNTSPELWGKLKPLARQMRHQPTPAEDALWQRLRNRQIHNAKFRRQHAIERFIVDFFCVDAKLIIEVDGAIHDYTPIEDAIRQQYLESLGLMVIRFTNGEVLQQIAGVVERIDEVLFERLPPTLG